MPKIVFIWNQNVGDLPPWKIAIRRPNMEIECSNQVQESQSLQARNHAFATGGDLPAIPYQAEWVIPI